MLVILTQKEWVKNNFTRVKSDMDTDVHVFYRKLEKMRVGVDQSTCCVLYVLWRVDDLWRRSLDMLSQGRFQRLSNGF